MDERRVPPQDIESELSVLGAVFCDNSCLKKVRSLIDATDFYRENHRKIFHAMLALELQNSPLDLVTMSHQLKTEGHLEEIGGGAYLAQLIDYVPTSANVHYYCKIVKNKAVARRVISYGQDLAAKAYDDMLDLTEELKTAKTGLAEIIGSLDGLSGVSLKDILNLDHRAAIYNQYIKKIETARFLTGFEDLDKLIRGVAPGEVMTIIAYAGTYKTAFLQNLLLRNANRTKEFHLFFSLEMPAAKLYERECQYSHEINGYQVEWSHRRFDTDKINESLCESGSTYLLVCEKSKLSLDKMDRYVDIARQKYGSIAAIGIDYMGLMDAPGKTLFEKTQFISAETKNLAKASQLPVIILCQINRESVKNIKGIETHSAKGGGDIEAGCDFMLGFYQDGEDLMCRLLKNRNGPSQILFNVDIHRPSLKFHNITVAKEKPRQDKQEAF